MTNKMLDRQRGDTIIEVLIAMVALSLVVTLSYNVMTQGIAYGQIALERSITQAMVSGQAAMLRDVFRRYDQTTDPSSPDAADWNAIVANYVMDAGSAIPPANMAGCAVTSHPKKFFFNPADPDPLTAQSPRLYSTIAPYVRQNTEPTYGDAMWIEGYKVTPVSGQKSYYDFYIKSCWDSPYGGVRQNMISSVRLYDTK